MSRPRLTLLVLGVVTLASWLNVAKAQPLIRPGDDLLQDEEADRLPEAESPDDDGLPDWRLSDAEPRRASKARRSADAEEAHRLSVQEQIIEMQREQMEADRAAKERETHLMRIAGITAIVVIAMTVLIAYARTKKEEAELSRAGAMQDKTSGDNDTIDPDGSA